MDEHCLQHVRGAVILEIRKWKRHPHRHQGKHSHRQVGAWSRNGIGVSLPNQKREHTGNKVGHTLHGPKSWRVLNKRLRILLC